jgi:hypothetical protein
MFMRNDYYQIMDKAFLNIDPATGLPTPYGNNDTVGIQQRDVLKTSNNANPSTVKVIFYGNNPNIDDDQGRKIYQEYDAETARSDVSYSVWVEKVPQKEVNICFQKKTFRKVKWIPGNNPTWFSGDDNLKGTHTTGIEGFD